MTVIRKHASRLTVALTVAALALTGCGGRHIALDKQRVGGWELRDLPPAEAPYWSPQTSENTTFAPFADADDVVWFVNEASETVHYHPTSLSQWSLKYLNSYRQTGDPRDLELAEIQAAKLLEIGELRDGVLWYPFDFDFQLHGHSRYVFQMTAPWYSGMTQGQVLSVFSRLYETTGKREYLKAARKVFASFDLPTGRLGEPWAAHVDENGYYWVSEYPSKAGDTKALNGFVFGLYGLYDYWAVTGDKRADKLLRAGILTVRDHYHLYRQPGGLSIYCLAHGVTAERYHRIHIEQMAQLGRITGDPMFAEFSRQLAEDSPPKASQLSTDTPFTERSVLETSGP